MLDEGMGVPAVVFVGFGVIDAKDEVGAFEAGSAQMLLHLLDGLVLVHDGREPWRRPCTR